MWFLGSFWIDFAEMSTRRLFNSMVYYTHLKQLTRQKKKILGIGL